MATLSAYIAWFVTTWTISGLDWDIPLWAATIVAMAFGFVLGAAAKFAVARRTTIVDRSESPEAPTDRRSAPSSAPSARNSPWRTE